MCWLGLGLSSKWKIWPLENYSSFLSRLHLTNFSSDWQKKGGQKKVYIRTEKLISLVYNINYHLVVPIDRAPQRLYSQRYGYRWRRNIYIPKHKAFIGRSRTLAQCRMGTFMEEVNEGKPLIITAKRTVLDVTWGL